MTFPRRSGILLHPTSLPGPFGIGDLGAEAYRFVDFLNTARQFYWQVLPLSPTGYADSPYQALSALAGNPLLISLEALVEMGHLTRQELEEHPTFPQERVDFGPVIRFKMGLLDRAFARFQNSVPADQRGQFEHFCREQAAWLDDVALFMAVKEAHGLRPWSEWEPAIAAREPAAIQRWRTSLAAEIEKQKYFQWLFFHQWLALCQRAGHSHHRRHSHLCLDGQRRRVGQPPPLSL